MERAAYGTFPLIKGMAPPSCIIGTIAAESLSPFLLFIAHPTVLKSPFYSKSSFTDTGIPCKNGREFYVPA
jgi:hypothetical protein